MSTKLPGISLAMLALLLGACAEKPAAKGPGPEEDAAALKALAHNDFIRAYNMRNAAQLAALHTEDAVQMPPNRPAVEGREAIEAGFAEEFANYTSTSFSQALETVQVSGDWASATGAYHWTSTPNAGGEPHERKGKWLTVYRRTPGGWKIVRSCWNTDTPLPAPAK